MTTNATIAEVARDVADGLVSSASLVADATARIAAHDRQGASLGAVITMNPQAMDDAEALDRERLRSGVRGPLHGVPIVIKDNIDVLGLPTTSGCIALAKAMPRCDAVQTARLRKAGAIILAKTNMSEFSFEIRSRSSIAGDVRNPFDTAVSAGGSSGGVAAAIAAGFAYGGLGTDTGGSIRTPASYNGLIGLRPTFGLLDLGGVAPLAPSADTIGPLGRSVADVAIMMAAMTGLNYAPPATSIDAIRGRRIGILRQAFGASDEIAKACEDALERLASAGLAIVDPVILPEAVLPTCPTDLVDYEFPNAFDAYLRSGFEGGIPSSLEEIVASGAHLVDYHDVLRRRLRVPLDRAPYERLLAWRDALADAVKSLMARHRLDALVYPTSAVVPTSLDNPRGGWAPEIAAYIGAPALTLPAGFSSGGIPIGIELLGHRQDDAGLMAIAAAVEAVLHFNHSPTSAQSQVEVEPNAD